MKKKTKAKSKHSGKYPMLLFGVLIGIIAGGSVVWWYNNKSTNWQFSKSLRNMLQKTFSFDSVDIDNKQVENEAGKGKDAINSEGEQLKKVLSKQDSIELLLFNDPSFSEYYEQFGGNPDSIVPDSSIYMLFKAKQAEKNEQSPPNEIVVKKDELVFSKTIKIENPSESGYDAKENLLDSLLTDKKTSKGSSSDVINVEFWKSPVNFNGFKMSRNKIVIYGMQPDENIILVKSANSMYVKAHNKCYSVVYTDVFKPLIQIKEPR